MVLYIRICNPRGENGRWEVEINYLMISVTKSAKGRKEAI
jgi:hypothetical protein